MPINAYDDMLAKDGKAPSGGNEYFDLLDDSREAGKQALQQSVVVGSKTNPDRQAKVIEVSNRTKLPPEIVERNFDEVSKKDTQAKPDYDLLIDNSPGLAKWLQDPNNAAVAHDDIDTLSKMERAASLVYKRPSTSSAMSMPGDLVRAGQTGWNNLNSSAWHLAAAYGLTTPQEAAQAVAEANKRANDLRAKMPDYATEFTKVMAEEAGDVDKSFRRFRSSFDSLRDGHVLKALTDYHIGGIKTVGETLDMIRAAVIRPRGLTYSTVENLAHSLPSLITGAAGAKTGAVVGGAAGTVVPGVGNVTLGTAGAMIGFGAGSFVGAVPVEVGSWINETLQKRGFDMTDPDAILRAYSDPALMTEVRGEAERKGLTTAAVDAVFNAFAGKLTAGAKPGMASKVLRGTADIGVQATGEATSEFAGQVAAKKGFEGTSLGEAIQEGITSLGHSMGEVAIGATVQAGGKMRQTLHKDPVKAVEEVSTKTDQAVQAQRDAQALSEVGQFVKESKLAKRLPDKLQNLVEVATEGQEATSVFFQAADWDKHWQGKGLSPATAASQVMGDGGKAYYEAKSTGAQIEIQLANYVAKVATTEHFDSLLSVARTKPDGMTLDEAKVFLQELPGVMDTLANEVTATPAEQTAEESAAKVAGNVTEQLKGAGFDEATAGTYAKVWESAFRTLGQRAGVDPMELFRKYAPQIQKTDIAQATEGQVFNQGADIQPFKNTQEAIAFGRTNAGNAEAIAQLEAKMADVNQRIAAEPDMNKKFALTFEHQFYREARDTAKGAKEFQQGSAGDQTLTPEFKKWFGESKVVDQAGKPLVVYHGTWSDITSFDKTNRDIGVHFGTSEQANKRLKDKAASLPLAPENVPASVMPVFLNIQNPLRLEDAGLWDAKHLRPVLIKSGQFSDEDVAGKSLVQLRKLIQSKGYDGIVYRNDVESEMPGFFAQDSYVVFDPKQVKSATGNKGTFDPNNPNILFQAALPPKSEEAAALEAKAVEKFGLTDDFAKAGFVLTDGRMLNFTDAKGQRTAVHRDVSQIYPSEGRSREGTFELHDFLEQTRAIRIFNYNMGDGQHLTIETHGKLSQEQLAAVNDYLSSNVIKDATFEVTGVGKLSNREELVRQQSFDDPTGEDVAKFFNGSSLFQGKEDEARGRIRFGDGRQFKIDLLKNADLSTFLHESGHFYLEVLGDLATAENATAEIKADYQTLLDFAEAKNGKVTREGHEKIARAFEAYLMEGKAPTSALRQAFARFRAWLVSIYKQMANLNVQLTPEVRGVFDRLLATQEEITAAESEQNIQPLFADPKSIGMTDKEAEQYTKAVAEARHSAEEELSNKVMAGWKREQQAWWGEERAKVRTDVAVQVDAMPVYRALDDLQRKGTPDTPDFKLSKQAIESDFGKDRLKTLPKPYVYVAKGGLHHDTVAEMYGFKSGDELLTALSSAVPKNKLIDQMTDQKMREAHPDMVRDPDAMKKEAVAAVHNEKRSQLLHKELQHLASQNLPALKTAVKRMTRRIPPVAAVRAQAEQIIAKKKVRDIKPVMYQQAEARSAKEAVEAVLKGDFDLAFEAKQRELLNHELFRAATNAREEDDATVSYMAKFVKPAVRERLGKAGPSYLEQVDDIMERFDFRRGITLRAVDKRTSLVAWLEEQKAIGFNPVIPEYVLNDAYRKHYKEMTHEELVGVRDTVKNIESMATLKNKLLKAQRMRELDAAVDEAVASIEANSKGVRPREIETRLPQDEFSRGMVGFFASHRKFASFIRQMDGFKDGGVMWELFARPMNEAGNTEAVLKEKAATALKGIFDAYSTKDIARMYRKENIPEIGRSLTKMGQLMVALNWGNSDNRTKMMDGQNWTEAQVQAILSKLDARDVKVVNQIWEFIDTYWPESKAISERVNGVAPSKVEAEPFSIGDNQFRGGYFPLKYDDRQAPKAYANLAKEAADSAMRGASIRSTTAHGHREERVQGVKMPIRLDFGSIFEHVGQVIHDQTHYEFLIDMNRLLGNKRMQDAIISHYGNEVYAQLRDAMRDVAAGDVPSQSSFEKGINWLRTGTSVAMMGWNFMTALVQPLGITQSIVRIGPKHFARGLSRWLGDASRMENTVRWIHERSDFMRLRSKTQMREINEIRNSLRVKGRIMDAAENSYFWLITRGQMIADVPTWLGAYEKAFADMEQDQDIKAEDRENRAIALADQAVLDAQGGGQIKDLADIQRGGPLKKLWTNFYSFFNTTYNLTAESVGRTDFGSAKDVGRLASDMLMLYTVPAVLGLALREAFRGGDDDKEWPEKAVREQASYLMGTIVGLRELGGIVQGFQGYEGPAGTRFFTEIGKLVKQVEQGEADEAFWKALNKSAGIILHYPAAQIERTVRGIVALSDGDTDNPTAVLVGPKR